MKRIGSAVVLTLALGFAAVGIVSSLSDTAYAQEDDTARTRTLWDNIKASGTVGLIEILLSVVGLALTLEDFVSIRREKLIPPHLLGELESLFDEEEYEEAMDLCDAEDSVLSRIVGASLAKIGGGYARMREAAEGVSEEETLALVQKISYVALIASIEPMLGLLGTVQGMISAFDKIAMLKTAVSPSDLAGSIAMALVTTAIGLIVAIPLTAVYLFLRNRVMKLTQEAGAITVELLERFRKEG